MFAMVSTIYTMIAVASASAGLGPGNGAWQTGSPEANGLSSKALAQADVDVNSLAPVRHCLIVVKNGVIVKESYAEGTATTLRETDSLAKTATGACDTAAQC